MDLQALQLIKLGIAAAAVVLVWWGHRASRGRGSASRARDLCLVGLAAIGVTAYFDFGEYPKFGQFANPHDLFHYYLGSKYSREVGYRDLYPAVIVATADNHGGRVVHTKFRRMTTYKFASAQRAMDRAEEIRSSFGERRWRTFRGDLLVFERLLAHRFGGVVRDMGYNATPFWNAVARPIANLVPARAVGWLAALDLALLSVAVLAVAWAFGRPTALLWIIAFGSCFCMSYTHIRGAFLRLDWLVALVIATGALRRERPRLAGALLAWATMSRVLPGVFLLGVVGWAIWRARESRRIPRLTLDLVVAFAGTCFLLGLFTLWSDGGLAHTRAFVAKITLHNEHIAPIRVGFKYLFLGITRVPHGDWSSLRAEKIEQFASLAPLWWAIQAIVAGATIWATRRLAAWEALAIGYVPAYFIAAPTFYYHVVTLVPFLFLAGRIDRPSRAVGATAFFGISIILFTLAQFLELGLTLAFTFSVLLLAFCLYLLWESHRGQGQPVAARATGAAATNATDHRHLRVCSGVALAGLAGTTWVAFREIDRWAAHHFAQPPLGAMLVQVIDLAVIGIAVCCAPALARLLARATQRFS